MKLTKTQLKRIIKEELLKEMYQPTDPTTAMNKIKEIAEQALMNKSFGVAGAGVADKYWQEIISVLKSTTGAKSLPGEEWDPSKGFGSAPSQAPKMGKLGLDVPEEARSAMNRDK